MRQKATIAIKIHNFSIFNWMLTGTTKYKTNDGANLKLFKSDLKTSNKIKNSSFSSNTIAFLKFPCSAF